MDDPKQILLKIAEVLASGGYSLMGSPEATDRPPPPKPNPVSEDRGWHPSKGPELTPEARILQEKAQATHEAIAATAAAKVSLRATREWEVRGTAPSGAVTSAARLYRECEAVMNRRIEEEIDAQINLGIHQVKG